MTTPLFMLRAAQMGISIADLELLSIGLVLDMYVESANDSYEYDTIGTNDDMRRMFR